MSSRSWKKYFTGLPSNDDGNKNLNYFHGDLNNTFPTRDRIKNITKDNYDVVACVDGENKVQLIHSISNLGGTRSQSKDKILGIIGMEKQGIFVELIISSVNTDCNFPAPSLADYKQFRSNKELDELEVDDGGTFKGSSCFIPGPFLCCVLTNDPPEWIPMVIHAG